MENPPASRLTLFRGVNRDKVLALLQRAEQLDVARGGLIMRHGERVPGLFALVAGSVKTRLQHANGGELVLALLGPGDTFGETPALLRRPAKLDAVALTDSKLAVFETHSVLRLLDSDRRFCRNLTTLLAVHMDELLAQLEAGTQCSARRLASYLESLARPGDAPGQWMARLPVSKTLVAAQLGVKKETLSRLLKQLATRGVIAVEQREIAILDRDGLRRMASL